MRFACYLPWGARTYVQVAGLDGPTAPPRPPCLRATVGRAGLGHGVPRNGVAGHRRPAVAANQVGVRTCRSGVPSRVGVLQVLRGSTGQSQKL